MKNRKLNLKIALSLLAVVAVGFSGWKLFADSEYEAGPLNEERGDVTIFSATSGSEELKSFIVNEFSGECNQPYDSKTYVSIDKNDDQFAKLSRGCTAPHEHVFAQKESTQWQLIDESYSQFVGSTPRCEIVDEYQISDSVAPHCLEFNDELERYTLRGDIDPLRFGEN